MIVVDAAIVVDALLEVSADSQWVRDRLRRETEPWAAPELMDAEVAHVIRRQVLRGELPSAAGESALADLTTMPIERHSHLPLVQRALSFLQGSGVEAYAAETRGVNLPQTISAVRQYIDIQNQLINRGQ